MKTKRTKGNVPPEMAIAEVKEEILEHVRALADGRVMTVYPIVEKGKELLELERASGVPDSHGSSAMETNSPRKPPRRANVLPEEF